MELYANLRPMFLGATIAVTMMAAFTKDKEVFQKLLGIGIISALLMIASVIAAKG